MNEDFEQYLRHQLPREIPAAWRAEILAVARPAPRASRLRAWLSTINCEPSTFLRWSPLAAAWLVIFALNHATRDPATLVSTQSTPPSPQLVLALREQRRLFAELTETASVATPADRPRPLELQPHSQRRIEIKFV
ncbi:MAG: hypothetical protein RLZZ350_568 [Verrucomicrobiota bacterium]|jgi:hypothetical protein